MTCRGCQTIFEFVATDIEFQQEMLEDESFGYKFFVECPGCSKEIVLRNLPKLVQETVIGKD